MILKKQEKVFVGVLVAKIAFDYLDGFPPGADFHVVRV